jgi:hypothetical protein
MLINQYREELDVVAGCRNNRHVRDFYQTEPQLNARGHGPVAPERTIFSEEY